MRALLAKPLPPQAWEVLAAALLIGWRAWMHPIGGLWRDWFTILCAFWIFTAVASKTKAWPYVSGVVMAGLLVLYGSGHLPLALTPLGPAR